MVELRLRTALGALFIVSIGNLTVHDAYLIELTLIQVLRSKVSGLTKSIKTNGRS